MKFRSVGLACLIGVALLVSGTPTVFAQSLASVPGVVLSHEPSPSLLQIVLGQDKYISDPSIVVLSNGCYVAAHALFGNGSGSTVSGNTKLFRSSDGGTNWTSLGTLGGILRASLFVHGGALYLMGAEAEGKPNVIRKSLDGGNTWTTPVDSTTGQLGVGGLGTPNIPTVFAGRLWSGATTRTFSAPVGADLLRADSWTLGNAPASDTNWFAGRWQSWTEGQIVASPGQGVVVMPKVRALPYSALIRANPISGNVSFDPATEFVALPGGEKKFGATYDPVSGKFFVLSNPVLLAHASDPTLGATPEMIRNTAAVLTSSDLYNWEVERIFLYTPNISYEAFQYFNFAFDGEDIVVASRTAFDVGGNKPPRGHDSNLLTFHRIAGFRHLSPEHVLALDTANGRILRRERTQHADAPLGDFPQGNTFDGTPLTAPAGLAQASDGDVYVREQGGRILRFDASGNFIGVAGAAPVPFQAEPIAITQPATGQRTWTCPRSGAWEEPTNWYYWGRPDTPAETAIFGSAARAPTTVTIESTSRVWSFNTNGDLGGWITQNVTTPEVTNGVLRGVATTADPRVYRTDLSISGWIFHEIKVRMRANVPSADVDLYWGTTATNTFSESRKVRVAYTGNGAPQELIFPLANAAGWDGQVITRIRIDPLNAATAVGQSFEIDSITARKDDFRIAGILFRCPQPYTISGPGSVRINPASGPGAIDVRLGNHVIGAPMVLGADAYLSLAAGASLQFRSSPDLNAKHLTISGPGAALATNDFDIGAGHLSVAGNARFAVGGALRLGGGQLSLDDGTATASELVCQTNASSILRSVLREGTNAPLAIAGNVSLGSATRLEIALPGDATISRGDTFDLVRYGGSLSGTFYGLPEGATLESGGHVFSIGYALGGAIRLTCLGLSFRGWIDRYDLPEGQDTPNANPAGDGVPNLLKYLLGVDPLQPMPYDRLPAATIREIGGTHYLLLEVSKEPSAAYAECEVEVSDDLIAWWRGAPNVTVVEDTETLLLAGMATGTKPRGFLRLLVKLKTGQ